MPRTARLSSISVSYYEPKHGAIEGRAKGTRWGKGESNIGVQLSVIHNEAQKTVRIPPSKGRTPKAKYPKQKSKPTISQDRQVQQISYDSPLPHPSPTPIIDQLSSLNKKVQSQNSLLFASNRSLFQKDMSIATDEQISGNKIPDEFKQDFRDNLQRAANQTALRFGADVGTAAGFARSIASIVPPPQQPNQVGQSALFDNGLSI